MLISRITTKRKGKKIEEKWDNNIFLINKNTRKKIKSNAEQVRQRKSTVNGSFKPKYMHNYIRYKWSKYSN